VDYNELWEVNKVIQLKKEAHDREVEARKIKEE
jgi:hypothetical protein